ncbi:MAG: hypothetical protein PF692_00560, partial [Kiritimatiellae bacterium]|nr:hypothetical protein [Kiritimatiellia bacterium]
HPQKQNHPVKNRAWDFSSDSSICTWVNRPQLPETASVTSTYRYETVSGISYWLSRDPITENGGLNLYAHTQNNPVDLVDADGRAAYPTWGPTPLKTQLINKHYEKIRKKLIQELKGLCPKSKIEEWDHPLKTTGSKYKKKYTLCCNRSDCLKEATSIANSYIGAIKAAWLAEHKKHFIVKGHYPGNFRARGGCSICAGEGADDWMCGDGLICGGWASLGHSTITQLPAYKKSQCWVSQLKIKYFWFTKKPMHAFVILHAPEGTKKLDPWAWGGWYY